MLRILIAVAVVVLPTCWSGDVCPPKSSLPACSCRNIVLEDGRPVVTLPAGPEGANATLSPLETGLVGSSTRGRRSLYTIVGCSAFRTPQELELSVSLGLHRKRVDELIISGVPPVKEHALARLPRGWLRHVRVKQFEINNSQMSGDFIWYNNPFEGQGNYLLWFEAHRCSLCGALTYEDLGTTNTKGLGNLTRLEGLDLSLNHLVAVKSTAFSDPPTNLSTVKLSWNSLGVVEDGAFVRLVQLSCIDMSHNLLEKLSRGIFATPAVHLTNIDLSWNFLKSVPEDFFGGMPKLTVVNLSKNFLFSLSENLWSLVWRKLTDVDVSGNFIECDCGLLWLLPNTTLATDISTQIATDISTQIATTPSTKPSVGRKVKGQCYSSKQPNYYTVQYNIGTLTRSNLLC